MSSTHVSIPTVSTWPFFFSSLLSVAPFFFFLFSLFALHFYTFFTVPLGLLVSCSLLPACRGVRLYFVLQLLKWMAFSVLFSPFLSHTSPALSQVRPSGSQPASPGPHSWVHTHIRHLVPSRRSCGMTMFHFSFLFCIRKLSPASCCWVIL